MYNPHPQSLVGGSSYLLTGENKLQGPDGAKNFCTTGYNKILMQQNEIISTIYDYLVAISVKYPGQPKKLEPNLEPKNPVPNLLIVFSHKIFIRTNEKQDRN